MQYDFGEVINRRHSNSVKWANSGCYDLNMWVADMDFRVAQPIVDALESRVDHGIFGYAKLPEEYYVAIKQWCASRYSFNVSENWLLFASGVIPSLSAVIQALTNSGDKVLIQTPVYQYFNTSIVNNGCEIVANHLVYRDGKYSINFQDFENLVAREEVKIFLLCNPHNPVGRVWTYDELKRMGELCLKNGVLILSDDAHCDLVYRPNKYMPFASVNEEFLQNSITCFSPGKAFNLAGLQIANMLIANKEIREKVNRSININEVAEPNCMVDVALMAAYALCDNWLEQLVTYLDGNMKFMTEFISEKLPYLKITPAEATYLAWINIDALEISSDEFCSRLEREKKLRLNSGSIYGENKHQFIRMNIASPRVQVEEAMNRIKHFLDENFS